MNVKKMLYEYFVLWMYVFLFLGGVFTIVTLVEWISTQRWGYAEYYFIVFNAIGIALIGVRHIDGEYK